MHKEDNKHLATIIDFWLEMFMLDWEKYTNEFTHFGLKLIMPLMPI